MTQRDRQEVNRLVAELGADLRAADDLANRLVRWSAKDAQPDEEVLIPAAQLHHFYTSIETALRRLIEHIEGSAPAAVADSHARLLQLAALDIEGTRPALIAAADVDVLRELLGFRHLFRHGYAARYRPDRIRELAKLAVDTWPSVKASLERAIELLHAAAQ